MPNKIDSTLGKLKGICRPAIVPFVTVGFPNYEVSIEIAVAILKSGADMLELGVPFSDPLAEGPTIQKTSHVSLKNGINVKSCIDAVKKIRSTGIEKPILLMGYYNPFLRYGLEKFVKEASQVGVDGVIVPDLPNEESGNLRKLCESYGIYFIPLLAPTSTAERISHTCKRARGFIYCVQTTGVTGAREKLSQDAASLVRAIRNHTSLPVLVGFGISNSEHVLNVGKFADGVIVGSALLDAIDRAPKNERLEVAVEFVRELVPTVT